MITVLTSVLIGLLITFGCVLLTLVLSSAMSRSRADSAAMQGIGRDHMWDD
jgi:hypothetical protein